MTPNFKDKQITPTPGHATPCRDKSAFVCAQPLAVTDSLRATVYRQAEEQEAGPVTDWLDGWQPVAGAAVR